MARKGRQQQERTPVIDREIAWIRFNERVLEEAEDHRNPVLERVRFLSIWHTNLDEFFMIRISGIKQQLSAGIDIITEDGVTPAQRLTRLRKMLQASIERAQACLDKLLLHDLPRAHIQLVRWADLTPDERARWNTWYQQRVHPILTPLAISPVLPFPFISNLSLNLAVFVEGLDGEEHLARIKIPDHLPRFLSIDDSAEPRQPPVRLLPITDLIAANLHQLFPNVDVGRPCVFRVTRDADVEIHEDEADDLLKLIEGELRKRRFGLPVRLEIEDTAPRPMVQELRQGLQLTDADVFPVPLVVDPAALNSITRLDVPGGTFKPFVPRPHRELTGPEIFHRISRGDVLLHHPFDSFAPVAELVRQAARDPAVLAIKMTLYRTSGDSPVVQALLDAVEQGKQVAAVVELKARFDEKNNIVWARRLEEAGVHVIYGVPHLKTHCKVCLIVRREGDQLRRYAHIGTGNYNPNTARVYTDLGLLTCDPDITADCADLFNRITGFGLPTAYRKILVAPRFLRNQLMEQLQIEVTEAREGRPAHVIAKCNAITDRAVIAALYDASRAGVQIDLIVRGACSLIPGLPGVSENIRVRSVVGRFLEHSRVFWFHQAGRPRAWIGSADLMERNLERRVEVLVPIDDPGLSAWLRDTFLQRYLDDVGRSRVMDRHGHYHRLPPGDPPGPDVHQIFLSNGRRSTSEATSAR